jgi:hypothetical protein
VDHSPLPVPPTGWADVLGAHDESHLFRASRLPGGPCHGGAADVWVLGALGASHEHPLAVFGWLRVAARPGREPSQEGESIEVGVGRRAAVGLGSSRTHRAGAEAGAEAEVDNEMDKALSLAVMGKLPKRAAAAAAAAVVVHTVAADMCLGGRKAEVGPGVDRRQEHSNRPEEDIVMGKKAARMGIAGRTGAAVVGVLDIVHNEPVEGVAGSLQDSG